MSFVEYQKRGRVAYVTLNRPEVLNAIHPPTNDELCRAWDEFAADSDAWVAILTGAGDRAFSVGADLKYLAERPGETMPITEGGFGGLVARFDLWKPIIAAVNGIAVGGGMEMALACDIIVASDTARFGLTEPKVGRVPGTGLHRLARQVPLKQAMGMALTGRIIGAEEAYRIGLVNEVVPSGQALDAAQRWADEIMECAPLAVQGCKQSMTEGLNLSLQEALAASYEIVSAVGTSEDREEGARAFAEKRKPVWKGR